jgi:hypothetical protein
MRIGLCGQRLGRFAASSAARGRGETCSQDRGQERGCAATSAQREGRCLANNAKSERDMRTGLCGEMGEMPSQQWGGAGGDAQPAPLRKGRCLGNPPVREGLENGSLSSVREESSAANAKV